MDKKLINVNGMEFAKMKNKIFSIILFILSTSTANAAHWITNAEIGRISVMQNGDLYVFKGDGTDWDIGAEGCLQSKYIVIRKIIAGSAYMFGGVLVAKSENSTLNIEINSCIDLGGGNTYPLVRRIDLL